MIIDKRKQIREIVIKLESTDNFDLDTFIDGMIAELTDMQCLEKLKVEITLR